MGTGPCHHHEHYIFEAIIVCMRCYEVTDLPATWHHHGWAHYPNHDPHDALTDIYNLMFPWIEFDEELHS